MVLATPGSGKPLLENPESGAGALVPTSTRVPGLGAGPEGPGPSAPARNVDEAPKGMWVVTHAEHVQLPAQTPTLGTPSGRWIIPAFGPTYVGLGPVVCVQPSEADGGVRPAGRPYQPPTTDSAE